ncbi:colicin E3/pyocin S6 family cytotoxin [Coraliomargarita sp. W4R53]
MTKLSKPIPCYLDSFKKHRVVSCVQVWATDSGDRFYTWDSLHGEIEVFNKRGRHLGVLHAVTGVKIKDAVHGRTLNLK